MVGANPGRMQCVVKNARVVTSAQEYMANIGIRDGRFAALVDVGTPLEGKTVIDAEGRPVLPGIVDPHVHYTAKPTASFQDLVLSETRAGAAGGVTTQGIFMHYRDDPIPQWLAANAEVINTCSMVDAGFHVLFTTTPIDIESLATWVAHGVPSWKLSIGYKGPQAAGRSPINDGDVWEVMAAATKFPYPAMVMVHAENPDIMLKGRALVERTGRQDMQAWNDTRPNFVEEECMRMCLFLSKVTGCRLYIVHITIGEGVALIVDARREGIDVVAETCPQYLTHNSEEPVPLLREIPTLANVNPPLRNKWSNEKLWEGVRQGIIDTIGSDHAANTLAEKGRDIWKAPMGLGNVSGMILPVMLSEGVNKGRVSLQDVVRVCCANPAKALGLHPKKGAISIGADGDLVIVDLDREVEVTHKNLHSRCDWNIWEGWKFRGWPTHTILRGELVYQEGRFLAEPGVGKFIPRKVS